MQNKSYCSQRFFWASDFSEAMELVESAYNDENGMIEAILASYIAGESSSEELEFSLQFLAERAAQRLKIWERE